MSRSLGRVLQWENPVAVWFRNRLMSSWVGRRHGERVLGDLLVFDPAPASRPGG